MATVVEDNNEVFIFAGNAKDIRYSCSGPLQLAVTAGVMQYEFKMDPILGEVRVPLRQLLSALRVPSINISESRHAITAVYIVDQDEVDPAHQVELTVMPGRIGCRQEDVYDELMSKFATWRPQVCKVCKWGKDRMYIIVPDSVDNNIPSNLTVRGRLKAYTDVGLLTDNYFFTFSNANGDILSISSDYSTVESVLKHKNPDLDFGEIIAYDINFYWVDDGTVHESAAQRFVLARSRSDWRQFIFRNNLGVFDALYSTGSFSDVPEYDIIQFRNNEVDNEISNNVSQIFEVNTGRINDELERRMWKEFFESDERYILSPDNQTPRRIVLDDVICEHTLRQNNVATFRFHFAEPDSGRLVQRGELPEWTDYGGRLMTAEGNYFKTSEGKFIILKRD